MSRKLPDGSAWKIDLSAGPFRFDVVAGEEPCAGAQRSIPEAVLRASAILRVLRVKLRRRDA